MNARRKALELISNHPARTECKIDYTRESITSIYASQVFHEGIQRERLSSEVFKSLQQTIKNGEALDARVADHVATAMRNWALEHGATHYSHWFQPLTGSTAEKHDSFITPTDSHTVLAKFSGSELIRGESDASSFPSGGLRATFEARGYTAWDPSSPAFILENPNGATLVIPTMFVSWAGEALDQKTPMLRSMGALNYHALRVLRVFGNKTARRVECTLGVEQEYFLVDLRLATLRPDLLITGRSLFGAKPPKGQELDDNYFGVIDQRVLAFMTEVEYELLRLGVPIKTRHNEVAPAQYELAPTYERTNLALDHQMLIMQLLRQIAARHGFLCLLHEKPFASVNGSGKHNNWSISTNEGENLLEPGDTPSSNAQFLVFCAAVCRAVYRYAKVLRMSIASAGNDHRLGASEAPPAIMSIHLGNTLCDIFNHFMDGGDNAQPAVEPIHIGVSMLPRLPRHNGDRNRTSPFAFTANKFEFRAVGSAQNSSAPITVLNTIVAESLDYVATYLEKSVASGKEFNIAVREMLGEMVREFSPILFNGDNYSQEWNAEALRRGLPNLRNTAECLPVITEQETLALFSKYGIYSEPELRSRQEILAETYCTTVSIEAGTSLKLARTMILPAALKYKTQLEQAATTPIQKMHMEEYNGLVDLLLRAIDQLRCAISYITDHVGLDRVNYCCNELLPRMHAMRMIVDHLEEMTDDEHWPLPTYSEMLFIR